MGLVSEAIATGLGYQSHGEGVERVKLTLETIFNHWPRETHSGFLVHFSNRNWDALSEFSTIDTAELVLGALFAGNYFGGEVLNLALQLKEATKWSDALEASDSGRIYPVVDPETGVFS